MNNISEANKQQENISKKPEYCHQCLQFFGNPQNDNLCSKCYRDKQLIQNKLNSSQLEQKSFIENSNENLVIQKQQNIQQQQQQKQQISSEKMDIEVMPQLKQMNMQVCYNCSRKIGFLGYKCKCEFTFCKFHRLPEEHNCNYDFQNKGKEKLAKENPLVMKSKLKKKDF